MNSETKLFLAIIIITLAIVGAAIGLFSQPSPTFTKDQLIPRGTITKGLENATAYLVEFSDFQCPACKAFQPTVDAILKKYPDTLLFAYRHFPLQQHQYGEPMAKLAEAAGLQGKFWEMHDWLFANQETFTTDKIADSVKTLGLDEVKIRADMNASSVRDKIMLDTSDGKRFGVNATPTFFLNGKKLTLSSFSDLDAAVADAVQQKKATQ